MARHPSTEGNDLSPARVDAQIDVTVPDGEGGRRSLKGFEAEVSEQLEETERIAEQLAVIL